METIQSVRPPAVAGAFYPASAATLDAVVERELTDARARARARSRSHTPSAARGACPKALVVPHAGYVYSGPVAASAYVLLEPFADRIERVVLVGPAHRVFVEGLASPGAERLRTPLGDVVVDTAALEGARPRGAAIGVSAAAHAREHSLEVQLPFLQKVAPHAKVIPLVVGRAPAAEVAAVLEALWGGPETVIVISSDLSHYLPYDVGRRADERTAARIVDLDAAPLDGEEACGAAGINGLVVVARARGLSGELVELASSGDTAGTRAEVVGYGAFAFYEGAEEHR